MSDASLPEWGFYLDDMIDFAGKVLAYTRRARPSRFCGQRTDL